MQGKIELQVREILEAEPDNGFTTEDLCQRIYGAAEKKHRVSMLRVVKRISGADPRYATLTSEQRGGTPIVYNCTSTYAYAVARLEGESFGYQREHDWWKSKVTEDDLHAELRDEQHQELIALGGAWWRFARVEWLDRPGENPEELAELRAWDEQRKLDAERAARLSGEPSPEQLARQAFDLLRPYFERTGEVGVTLLGPDGNRMMFATRF
jgi:hypothetical protein